MIFQEFTEQGAHFAFGTKSVYVTGYLFSACEVDTSNVQYAWFDGNEEPCIPFDFDEKKLLEMLERELYEQAVLDEREWIEREQNYLYA